MSSVAASPDLLGRTFLAALSAVGTAATLAFGGFYLHRRGYATVESKKVLSRFNQQVSVPAFYFSKLVRCKAGDLECTSTVWDEIGSVWILFVWPLYVVTTGMILGYVMSRLAGTPKWQIPSTTIAVAFCNSFSLPVTLMAVIAESHIVTGGDMTQYLSIYMIAQPILMWSVGGCFLTPVESDVTTATNSQANAVQNVDEETTNEATQLLTTGKMQQPKTLMSTLDPLFAVLNEALQPPVIAAITGLVVAALPPVRSLLVRDDSVFSWFFVGLMTVGQAVVPISMTVLGINLSISASNTSSTSSSNPDSVSWKTLWAVVASRMVIMPLVGLLSVWVLATKTGVLDSSTASSALYFVLLVVFITPTANTVMIMVELADGMREGMAKILGWQYFVSPVFLTCSITLVLQLAVSMTAEPTMATALDG